MASNTGQSQLLSAALKAIEGYNKWDIEMILQPRADHCTQRVYPDRFGRPFLNNQEYREYFPKFSSLFNHFHIEILETVEDPKNHKVAFHARSTGETVIGPYANEYMIMMQMTNDDKQVEGIKEFVDSAYSDDYFQRLGVHTASK